MEGAPLGGTNIDPPWIGLGTWPIRGTLRWHPDPEGRMAMDPIVAEHLWPSLLGTPEREG